MFSNSTLVIGVPVFNEEKYILNCLEAIAKQTHKDFLCVISDNNSADNTFQIASHFASDDPRFIVVKQSENIGSSENFNFLLKNSSSKYFIWIGGHDVISKDALKNYLSMMGEDVACVFSNFSIIDEKGLVKRIDKSGDKWDIHNKSNLIRYVKSSVVRGGCPPINGLFQRKFLLKLGHVPKFSGPDRFILPVVSYYGRLKKFQESQYYHREISNRMRVI